MHLELEIPRDNPFGFHPGERWTPEFGWEFMRAHCRIPDENLRFELNRYAAIKRWFARVAGQAGHIPITQG